MNFRLSLFCPAALFLSAISLFAGGSSYSSVGFGLPQPAYNTRGLGMGGVELAVPSFGSINTHNPATLMGIKMTRFDANLFIEGTGAKTATNSAYTSTSNIGRMAFAIPFGKILAASLNISRMTRVNYDFTQSTTSPQGVPYRQKYVGDGGLQALDFTVAGRIDTSIAVGFTAEYLFGTINRSWELDWNSTDFTNTDDRTESHTKGLRWTLGGLFQKEKFNVGAYVTISNTLTNDVVLISAGTDTTAKATHRVKFPFEYGLGGLYKFGDGYAVGSDLVYTTWGKAAFDGVDLDFRNTLKLAWGVEKSPSKELSTSWYQRLFYRAGFYVQNLYGRNASGRYTSEYFFTTGVGVPFNRDKNTFDFAFEVGRRGSVSQNKVQDTVFRFTLAISGGERWFQNRKKR